MIRKIDISGTWGFRADGEKKGIKAEYFTAAPEDTIELPSTTSIAKKGAPDAKHEDGSLTDPYLFEGWAWYYMTVDFGDISGKTVELLLERTRKTELWVNGRHAGGYDSLSAPHRHDITEYAVNGENSLCVLVSNTDYSTKGGHLTSPDTQTNWNGILGEMSVIVSERVRISDIQAYPDVQSKSVGLNITLEGTDSAEIEIWGASSDGRTVDRAEYTVTSGSMTDVPLGEDAALWSEYSPVIYTLKAAIKGSADIFTVHFGLRSIAAEGLDIKLNGRKIFLRGKHDGMIFPLTAAAPTTVEEWHRVLSIAKSWGINHYRFHTCCPPDAAFTAADMLGIYMQPEICFWGTITAEPTEERDYLVEEGRRMLREYGNHPSFVMMSLGNELWGDPPTLDSILAEYHSLDSRHLYTQGSNNFQFFPNIQENDDFFSGVRLSRERLIRGSYAMCDAPLGFIQTDEPNTAHSYDGLIFPEADESSEDGGAVEIEIQYGTGVKRVKAVGSSGLVPTKPLVTHEVGQYFVYPDYNEIEKYMGVLKPYSLEVFRERLKKAGMLSYADRFHRASGMLAFQCYKLEIEAAMRSEYLSGFQLLDLQDFSGQGVALVGMLNAFMEEKSFVQENGLREKWLGFCSDVVILAEIQSFVLTAGRSVEIPVKIRNMSAESLCGRTLKWRFGSQSGELAIPESASELFTAGTITILPDASGRQCLALCIDGVTENSYDMWVFDAPDGDFSIAESLEINGRTVFITSDITRAESLLHDGERVLCLPNELRESIKGFYCADFWNFPMFRAISESMGKEVPVGTLGLVIDCTHPALSGFPTEEYSTPQWYHIVSHADCAVLDGTPEEYRPIVQMADNVERNHKLALLYEAEVGEGRLLVCTARLSEISDRAEVQTLFRGLTEYIASDAFKPEFSADLGALCLR